MKLVDRRRRTLCGKQRRTIDFDESRRRGDKDDSLSPRKKTKTPNSQLKLDEPVDDLPGSRIPRTTQLEPLRCQTFSIFPHQSESVDVVSLPLNRSTIVECDRILDEDLVSSTSTTIIPSQRRISSPTFDLPSLGTTGEEETDSGKVETSLPSSSLEEATDLEVLDCTVVDILLAGCIEAEFL